MQIITQEADEVRLATNETIQLTPRKDFIVSKSVNLRVRASQAVEEIMLGEIYNNMMKTDKKDLNYELS